jgi:cytochrome c-type biogenesis protein
MKHTIILIGLFLIGGCLPTPSSNSSDDNTQIDSTYKNNISTLFGDGGKNAKDNIGAFVASNIIWKDSLGTTHSLDELRGKIILLNFWAIWCAPCEEEMPALQSIADSLKSDLCVVGVSVDRGSSIFDRVKSFVDSRKIRFQIVIDPAAKTYLNYGANSTIPWTFVINRDGHVYHAFNGAQIRKQFMDVINEIL